MAEAFPGGRRPRAVVLPSAAELEHDRARALALTPVSRETIARLNRFVALLLEWQQTTNLIAESTLPKLWTRHIADSLQLLRLAPEARIWVDLGAGAGFPGLVIACALVDRADITVHLVESHGRKCAFLREASHVTDVPTVLHCERIEQFTQRFSGPVEVVTARALAPLPALLKLAAPLLKTGAIGLFPKGQDVAAELTAASKCWKIESVVEPSVTSPASGIVVVRKLTSRAARPSRG